MVLVKWHPDEFQGDTGGFEPKEMGGSGHARVLNLRRWEEAGMQGV